MERMRYAIIGGRVRAAWRTQKGKEKIVEGVLRSVATVQDGSILGFVEIDKLGEKGVSYVEGVPWEIGTKLEML